jgi:osmoprotectant transport system ATP-binding protein
MAQAPAVIAFDAVSKRYANARGSALDRVSLEVAGREFLAVVGPSGSGKTTLLRLVNRLADPSEGTVRFEGRDVRALDAIELRRRIGYVFQGIGLFPHLTVAENVGITPKLLGWERKKVSTRVDELLSLVQLAPADYRNRLPAELSGGERQRVGIARAIAANPPVVLMDEPFGALDPLTRDALAQEYRRLHDQLGLTSILITHDMTEALLLADRIAVMNEGRVIEVDTPHALMTEAKHAYVHELMQTPRRRAERLGALMAGRK